MAFNTCHCSDLYPTEPSNDQSLFAGQMFAGRCTIMGVCNHNLKKFLACVKALNQSHLYGDCVMTTPQHPRL